MQCGPPNVMFVGSKTPGILVRYLPTINRSEIGVLNQLSYHKSAINPMNSQFSYGCPMGVVLASRQSASRIF